MQARSVVSRLGRHPGLDGELDGARERNVGLGELDAAFALLHDSPAEIKILVRPRP